MHGRRLRLNRGRGDRNLATLVRVGSGAYLAPASCGEGANDCGEAPGSTGTNGSGGGGLQRQLRLHSESRTPATPKLLLLLFLLQLKLLRWRWVIVVERGGVWCLERVWGGEFK